MSGRDPLHDPALNPALADARLGLMTGEFVGLVEGGRPLVVVESAGHTAAVAAHSLVDLDRRHVGARVAVMLEGGSADRPVILGVLDGTPGWPLRDVPGDVELESQGQRLVVTARHELVLRCGSASITMRADGRIELRGDTILTQAVRSNRIRGGSVELN